MFKKSLMVLATLAFTVACSSNPSREIAQERRWDDRDRRPGFEFGEYTSQRVENRDDRGFIDLSEAFGGFRGVLGKNLKGLLIEATYQDRRDPRDRRDGRPGMPSRPGMPMNTEIAVTYDRMPVERFTVTNLNGRQFFYLDLNRRLEDNFRQLNLEYNPRIVNIVNLTLLTNDDGLDRPGPGPFPGPGPGPIPQPPRRDEYGVLYINSFSNKYFFEKEFNAMEAELKAKNACFNGGNANFCKLLKSESLIPGEQDYFCRVDNTYSNFSYGAAAVGRLEAEAKAFLNCQAAGNTNFCKFNACSTGNVIQRNSITRCFSNNTYSNKTFLGRGQNDIEANLRAKEACQAEGNANFCKAGQCQTEQEPTPGPGPNPWPR
jgi:hypothetical protein